jgi:hypothetical protein
VEKVSLSRTFLALFLLASFVLATTGLAHAQSSNPFQKDQSKLIQQLNDQKKQPAAPVASEPTAPTTATQEQPRSPLPFDVSPELLRQLQTVEEPDYSNHFTNMNVVAVNGLHALIRSNDYFYYIKDGGSFTHNGLRFFVEIRDGNVHVLSPLGSEIYVGSVGSGPKAPELETAAEDNGKTTK